MHLAVLSAINYSNLVSTFLHDIVGMGDGGVRNSLIGEMTHQLVMCGALRTNNDSECHIYLMEAELANYLTSCVFDGATTQAISFASRPPKIAPHVRSGTQKGYLASQAV